MLQKPEDLSKLISPILKEQSFRERNVVATVPNPLQRLLFVNFSCKSHEDEAQAILSALRTRVSGNLGEYVLDYLPINPFGNDAQQNRMALVAMAKQQDIEDYLDLLTSCGLNPLALEVGPVAINRLISTISEEQDSQKILAINFGSYKSYLTVLWNREVLVDRAVDFGMEDVLKAIGRAFDVQKQTALEVLHRYGLAQPFQLNESEYSLSGDETQREDDDIKQALINIMKPCFRGLVNEIRDVLIYIASETRGGAVEQIYLLGSLARISDVDQLLDQMISIPVKTINPFYGLSHGDETGNDIGPLAGIAVATGLALRGRI